MSRLQYSLITIFILATALAAGLWFYAGQARRFREEQAARQTLEDNCDGLFFSLDMNEHVPRWSWSEIVNGRLYVPIQIAEWYDDGHSLLSSKITKAYSLRHLVDLKLERSTPEGMRVDFARFENLARLTVIDTELNTAELASINKLKNLNSLTLQRCRLRNESVDFLIGLSLQELCLSGNPDLSDIGLKSVCKMPNLIKLTLNETSVSGTIFSAKGFPEGIRELSLMKTKFSDDTCIAMRENFGNLKTLSIQQTLVTDKSIPLLAKHPTLERLRVKGSLITESGLTALKKSKLTIF